MSNWLGVLFLVAGFVFLIRVFGLIKKSKEAIAVSRHSFEIISDSALKDDDKEAALQHDAKRLFGLFFVLALGGGAAIVLPFGILWLASTLGLLSLHDVLALTLSPLFLVSSTLVAVLFLAKKKKRVAATESYSTMDRLLHRLSFRTYSAQIGLADMEDQLFAKELVASKNDRPVFITALPRAGTTLLLECFARIPGFASHCYRDMPFVLTPVLWSRFSAAFRQSNELKERAHGDGMLVNVDSPEALEEIIWKTFWKQHYRSDHIVPWQDEKHDEFEAFFQRHMEKIIFLRRESGRQNVRYISKNNLNIARTRVLRRMYPRAVIIVPFREPLHHAASLLEQHRNFLRIHAEDAFAAEYMRAIGHVDFGRHLCPVNFDNWLDHRSAQDALGLDFWLEYWVASYRYLLKHAADTVCFFNYQAFCSDPEKGLQSLADIVGDLSPAELRAASPDIHAPRPREIDTAHVPAALLKEVQGLYDELQRAARNRLQ